MFPNNFWFDHFDICFEFIWELACWPKAIGGLFDFLFIEVWICSFWLTTQFIKLFFEILCLAEVIFCFEFVCWIFCFWGFRLHFQLAEIELYFKPNFLTNFFGKFFVKSIVWPSDWLIVRFFFVHFCLEFELKPIQF